MHVLPLASAATLAGLLALVPATAPRVLPQDEEPPPQEEVEEPATDGLTQERLEALTAEMLKEVVALRGVEFPRGVRVEMTDAEGFRAYMMQRVEAEATPDEILAEETVAKLLGLLPADMDYLGTMMELVESQVGGFYDPITEGFYIMPGFGEGVVKSILVHELTHALDDQLHDLDAGLLSRKHNTDAQWAYHALVEGSGTIVMNVWMLRTMTQGELDLGDMQEIMDQGMEGLADAPGFLWKPLLGSYICGEKFLREMKKELELPERVKRAFEDPPRSSEQVLHPEKYWDPEERDEPVAVSFPEGFAPKGWSVLDENTAGELQLALVTEPLEKRKPITSPLAIIGVRYTHKAVDGWGGDRYVLLGRKNDRLLHIATTWDTEKDAVQFHAALAGLEEHIARAAAAYGGTVTEEGGEAPASQVHRVRLGSRVYLTIGSGAEAELVESAAGWAVFGEAGD